MMHNTASRVRFSAGVAPSLYVPVPAHEAVLAQLRQFIARGPSVSLLVGESGLGKSLLSMVMLKQYEKNLFPCYLPNAGVNDPGEFHRTLLHDLDKPGQHWFALADAITSGPGKLIVLDDFDHASDAVLHELRRLANLGAAHLLAVGTPRLAERVRQHGSLASRVMSVVTLEALSATDGVALMEQQAPGLIDDEAAATIVQLSGGVPRRIHALAAGALALGESLSEMPVSVEAVLAAAESLPLVPTASQASSSPTETQPHGQALPKEKARKRRAA